MQDFDFKRKKTATEWSAHPDYVRNLQQAQYYIEKYHNSLPEGMTLKLADSQHLSRSLFVIRYVVPLELRRKNAKFDDLTKPICLHECFEDFCLDVRSSIEWCIQMATKLSERRQISFIDDRTISSHGKDEKSKFKHLKDVSEDFYRRFIDEEAQKT